VHFENVASDFHVDFQVSASLSHRLELWLNIFDDCDKFDTIPALRIPAVISGSDVCSGVDSDILRIRQYPAFVPIFLRKECGISVQSRPSPSWFPHLVRKFVFLTSGDQHFSAARTLGFDEGELGRSQNHKMS
jgi:hypothetical protein